MYFWYAIAVSFSRQCRSNSLYTHMWSCYKLVSIYKQKSQIDVIFNKMIQILTFLEALLFHW